MKRAYLILLFTLCAVTLQAQILTYNLNKNNGLPSNTVYNSYVDHNGYLWLATENGVIRYNGYNIKKFDYNDGLPNIDVWHVHEDEQHRIILSSFSKVPGYIKNGKYHSFVLKGFDTSYQYIAPKYFHSREDTIWFYNQTGSWILATTDYIVGDTIYHVHVPEHKANMVTSSLPAINMFAIFDTSNHIYNYKIEDGRYTEPVILCKDIPKFLLDAINTSQHIENRDKAELFHIGDIHLIQHHERQKAYYINYKNCHIDSFQLFKPSANKQSILIGHPLNQYYTSLVSQDSIHIVDTNLSVKAFSFLELTGLENRKGHFGDYILYDSLWGKGLCTANDGIYFTLDDNPVFKPAKNLTDYLYVGRQNDSLSLWWNKEIGIIATLYQQKIISERKQKVYSQLKYIKYFSDDITHNFEKQGSYLLNIKTNSIYRPFEERDVFKYIDEEGNTVSHDKKTYGWLMEATKDVIAIDSNNVYGIGGGMNGLFHFQWNSKDTFVTKKIGNHKYNKLTYSKKHQCFFAYNDYVLLIYNMASDKKVMLSMDRLREIGINQIRKIVADEYGNIFIQDYDRLLLFDLKKLRLKQLLSNYNMEGAVMDLLNDKLIIAGNFGVAQYHIKGEGALTLSKLYPNTKGLLYNYVVDMNIAPHTVTIVTDKGAFFIDTNTPSYNNNNSRKRILYTYKEETSILQKVDTIILGNKNRQFALDVINPLSYGDLKFKYKLSDNAAWTELEGSDINLQNLKTNRYYHLRIQASDLGWRSNTYHTYLFIEPKWWQTQKGVFIIVLLSILGLSGLVITAVLITRKIISQNNERRNKERDLELKSIYSQINPHFIFNTLSTAMYYVKRNQNKEAFKHISQFSELLRAYLKASRNKYISIEDEAENLRNYLELQISRFEEKIQYKIEVDENLDAANTTIPSLLLQPIVENALNHGIFHKAGTGNVLIAFRKGERKEEVICIVDDDGIGREKAKSLRNVITKKVDSYGTILINELVNTFNKYEPIQVDIKYIDKEAPLSGTTVVITIKKN